MKNADKLVEWFKDKGMVASARRRSCAPAVAVVVAFSGGVDSSVVAKAAKIALDDKAIAVTARSMTLSADEFRKAKKTAREMGIKHEIFSENEFENPKFAENPPNRCYHCRKSLICGLKKIARKHGANFIVDGANASDACEHRPGAKAMREAGVRSPLAELKIPKSEVRKIAKHFGLSVFDKPSMACLASRIPYGERITKEKLAKIERAERLIRKLGFSQLRVRLHGDVARVEVPKKEMPKLLKASAKVSAKLRKIGFTYVTLDIDGYRAGSMDEVLK